MTVDITISFAFENTLVDAIVQDLIFASSYTSFFVRLDQLAQVAKNRLFFRICAEYLNLILFS